MTWLHFDHSHWDEHGKPRKRGIAPGHAVDMRRYTDGVPKGLHDWIWSERNKLVTIVIGDSQPCDCPGLDD